jgi:hypothetical protein
MSNLRSRARALCRRRRMRGASEGDGHNEIVIWGGLDNSGEIKRATICGEHIDEQSFTRASDEGLADFAARVRAARPSGGFIAWGGLPDMVWQ